MELPNSDALEAQLAEAHREIEKLNELVAYHHDACVRAEAEAERAWRERNQAQNKLAAWQSIVVAESLPLQVHPGREWGPGGEDSVVIPSVTTRRLTEILDELAALRAKTA